MYRPNENTTISLVSTQVKVKLADGSNAFYNPETKYVKEPITMTWLDIPNSNSFRTRLENYVINGTVLRITTHLSEQFIGNFISVNRVWLTAETDAFDLQAVFERTQ
jgi:hypothetical protein